MVHTPLYHLTSINSATEMINRQQLFMMPVVDGIVYTKEQLAPRKIPETYVFSTSRTMTSDFLVDFAEPGQVILVLNRDRFCHNFKVRPVVNPQALEEMGKGFNDMEEYIYSARNIAKLDGPLNQYIDSVRFVNMLHPNIYCQANQYSRAKFSPYDMRELLRVCAIANIPTNGFDSTEAMRSRII